MELIQISQVRTMLWQQEAFKLHPVFMLVQTLG